MSLQRICCLLLSAWSFALASQPVLAVGSLEQRVTSAIAELEGAEHRFRRPDPQGFENTRQALRVETQRVGEALDSHGKAYAKAWKDHLRWAFLTGNLGPVSEVDLEELALVRRWLYSNRKGLEYPFFAELRKRIDAHLDAVFIFSQPDLELAFQRQVANARQQLNAVVLAPNDTNLAALGRTLGWLERTKQLPRETAFLRSLLSYPNAQIVISKPLIDRAVALLAQKIDQSLPVSDRVTVAGRGLLSRARTASVHGSAHTEGEITLELVANAAFADLQLVYLGKIDSRCRALIGPVTVAMQTLGPVRAVTPVHVSLQGVQLLRTEVFPQVLTKVTGVQAKSNLIRRVGKRRSRDPKSVQQMNSRASFKTASLLQKEMDGRITGVLQEIQQELRQASKSLDSFNEVLAPVVREGASPRWESITSSAQSVTVNITSRRREQLGAVRSYSLPSGEADLQARIHVSFFNNMAETIMAGKTFADTYFMDYGKILHAELPPPLMVHTRSKRWAIVAAKPRPLEISIPGPNRFRIVLRMQRVEIEDEQFPGLTRATIEYHLVKNEFDEYQLERRGEVQLDSPLPEDRQEFLLHKLDAFFAPVLNGGGVALPEGGGLGQLRSLQPGSVEADRDWFSIGINVPTGFLEQWLPAQE